MKKVIAFRPSSGGSTVKRIFSTDTVDILIQMIGNGCILRPGPSGDNGFDHNLLTIGPVRIFTLIINVRRRSMGSVFVAGINARKDHSPISSVR